MVYATNLEFIQRSGLGIRVVDENVGTGDNSETDFDLDHDNVIDGGYVLSHAASGSNTMTALTETTHYSLDKESGRIVLTAGGVTEVGTDIIYATYWYSDTFSDTVVTAMVANADEQIDLLTGRKWDTATTVVEYRDGRKSLGYPTTDRPYDTDWDTPDFIVLEKTPVSKVSACYFLSLPCGVGKFYNYDSSGSSYTDKTDEVNSTTESPFTLFAGTPAVSDAVYVGCCEPFLGLDVVLSTVGTGSPSIDWEYYNGTEWADLSESDTDSGASTFTASGKFTWDYPYGWEKNSVNSQSYYWVRGVVSTGYTVAPVCVSVTVRDLVSEVVEPRSVLYTDWGKLNFTGVDVPSGTKNVRVDYSYGESSTPSYITELCVLIASVQAYVNLSGGSYDDATSYTLGSKSVTIGEVYVNIREVIDQFRKRINEILDMIGRRADIAVI